MRVDDDVIKAVVFVGIGDTSETFTPIGTGFLAEWKSAGATFLYLVTNAHITDGIWGDSISVRINRSGGGAHVLKIRRETLQCHDDPAIDLVVAPLLMDVQKYDVRTISLQTSILDDAAKAADGVGLGDDVFSVGLFTQHHGALENRPVVRFGAIAAMPGEKIRTERGMVSTYLIELRSIAGLSGSPVFVHMSPWRYKGSETDSTKNDLVQAKKSFYFAGILQGRFLSQDPTDTKSVSAELPVEDNTGIGVVIPYDRLVEIIQQPKFVKLREEILEHVAKLSDYRNSSKTTKKTE